MNTLRIKSTICAASLKALPLALALAAGAAHADDGTKMFSFSGFGTLGEAQTSSNAGEYIRDRQPGGANKNPDFNVDSNLGLQLTGVATSWLSGTVQVLSMERGDKNYITTDAEWAFLKLQPFEGLSIRAGRTDLPMFAISDFRNVGYANTWLRPPNEVYGLALLERLQGVDVSYHLPIASTKLDVTALAGTSFFYGAGGTVATVNNVKGLNLQWETEWATLRIGRIEGDVQLPGGSDHYAFTGIGAIVDRDNVVAQAEFVTRRSANNGSLVNADGWYVLGGYRFNSILPYVSYASEKPKTPGYPVHLNGSQSTLALGMRWDAWKSAALKFQIERVNTDGTAGVSFATPLLPGPPGAPPAGSPVTQPVTVFSVAVDYVF